MKEFLTPTQIVKELDKYIIGQSDAKKNVAIALRNRWRRMNTPAEIQKDIIPNNILLIGSTGVGKTEIARRLASVADAPFAKVEASKFTEVGYVGRDVESMVRDLVEHSVKMVKTKKQEEVRVKAEEIVEDVILDILIPPIKESASVQAQSVGYESGNTENNSDVNEMSEVELNEKTRDKFRDKIRSGELDDRLIEIDVTQSGSSAIGMVAPPGIDESSLLGIQDMIGNMMPKKNKKRKVKIADARKILMESEAEKLIDMEEVKEEAIFKAENTGIIFIDEVDKIAKGNKNGGGADVSREGVQRDLLPIVEGSTVNTKYGIMNTDHVLFVAAGAFHVSKPSDLIPELQGRFPIRVELDSLTNKDFYQILKTPKNALTKQYTALMKSEDVELSFTDDALQALADLAFQVNEEVENIGARRLHTVMSRLLNEFLFEIPDTIPPNSKISVTKEMVEEKLSGMVKNKDLSQYIL